jgi:hypothetical protein
MSRRLVNRRPSEILNFEAMGMRFTGSVSRYADGRVAEVFIDNHKAGSAVGTLGDCCQLCPAIRRRRRRYSKGVMPRQRDGRPLGPLSVLLDLIAGEGQQ